MPASPADAADDDFCYLTTRGRVTGEPHEIEIWFALDGGTLYLLSGSGPDSDWVRNLRVEPAVTVQLGDYLYEGTARVVRAGTKEDTKARRLVHGKYQPRSSGRLDGWRRRSLPVAIDLD